MKRLATLLALAAVALAVGCGSDTELKSMNFDSYQTYAAQHAAHVVQTAPTLRPLAELFDVGDAIQVAADQAPRNPFR